MPDKMIVSNSEIQTFKNCRRKWYLGHVRGLRAAKKATGPLQLGTNVHEALGSYYLDGGNPLSAMSLLERIYAETLENFPEPWDQDAIQKEYRLAYNMVEGYFQWAEEEGVDSGFTIVESEAEIEAEIHLPSFDLTVVVLGKRDLIFQDEHERKGFLDFKTCQTLGDSLLDINEQLLTYATLHKINNPDDMPQYAVWRMLRKTLRTEKAKPPFYAQEKVELSDRVLRNFYLRLVGTLEDMARVKNQLAEGADHRMACYPTASQMCAWGCDFRIGCPMIDRDPYSEEYLADNFIVHNPYERYQSKGVLE